MSLRQLIKPNLKLVLLVVMAFIVMVAVSYVYVGQIVNRQMTDISEEIMNTTETVVTSYLRESELSFSNIAQTVESMLTTQSTNAEILAYLKSTNSYYRSQRSPLPDFLKIYAYLRGDFLDGSGWIPPEDYRPEERPWHIGAKVDEMNIYFSEPYIDADTGEPCISFSQVVRNSLGEAMGVLAMDLDMSRVVNYVTEQQLAGNGYGLLISSSSTVAAHRDPALVGQSMMDCGAAYRRLAIMLNDEVPVSAERITDVNGVDSIAFFHTIFNGWHIGVVTPRSSYYSQVYILGLTLSALGLVLALALCALLLQIRRAQLQADEESRSKSEFLSRMSHEIRTPLNAIIGMTHIAREADDPERKNYGLDRVSEASEHLLGVINDILDISKIEAGKMQLEEEDVLVADIISQVDSVISFKVEEKHQHYSCSVGPGVPRAIVTDKQRLSQVITNLLGNAVKFTPEGGHISFSIESLGAEGEWHRLRFEVADDGIGISAEQQKRLFQSFEQANPEISRKYGGTGLGLAISKKIVGAMGGEASIESELGAGSRFIFVAPIREGDLEKAKENHRQHHPEAEDKAESDLPADYSGKRILLAEDVEINREILLSMLEDTHLTIDTAVDGADACQKFTAANGAYDLVFMDVQMPNMNGYEATRAIRAMPVPGAGSVPIIAMTADVFKEDVDKARAAGMNGHLGKPLDFEAVMRMLNTYLGQTGCGSVPPG